MLVHNVSSQFVTTIINTSQHTSYPLNIVAIQLVGTRTLHLLDLSSTRICQLSALANLGGQHHVRSKDRCDPYTYLAMVQPKDAAIVEATSGCHHLTYTGERLLALRSSCVEVDCR